MAAKCLEVNLSGYRDSNTGPSAPKADALANCATPRSALIKSATNILKKCHIVYVIDAN